MTIYCAACKIGHHFSDGEAERIIYVLQAELSDAQADTTILEHTRYIDGYCLRETESHAHNGELYREHVKGLVEQRKEARVTW